MGTLANHCCTVPSLTLTKDQLPAVLSTGFNLFTFYDKLCILRSNNNKLAIDRIMHIVSFITPFNKDSQEDQIFSFNLYLIFSRL